jgi:hypothetical protein
MTPITKLSPFKIARREVRMNDFERSLVEAEPVYEGYGKNVAAFEMP